MPSTSFIYWKEAENRWVTSDGRLFQVLVAATGNARSPIVESRVSGTASAEVDDECRHCRPIHDI